MEVDEEDEDDDDSFLRTSRDNSESFLNVYGKYDNVEEFLNRPDSETFITRSVNTNHGEQYLLLDTEYDIDGMVLELNSLKSLRLDIHYMNILPNGPQSIIPMYNILKKHIKLSTYSSTSQRLLKLCRGIQLCSVNGWQINLVLLPKKNLMQNRQVSSDEYSHFAYKTFMEFKDNYQRKVCSLSAEDLNRDTVKKNKVFDVSKWRILSKDQEFILELYDDVIEGTDIHESHKFRIIAFRFGERETREVHLARDFDESGISSMTAHAAITLKSEKVNLMWSREGIQELIGQRGILRPAFSFRDCANYQSNLDGRELDLKEELREITSYPNNIRFLQLYADIPHMHCNAIHPVSGAICTSGLLHHKTNTLLHKKSEEYVNVCRENSHKLGGSISVRLEVVVFLDEIPSMLTGRAFFSVTRFRRLLNSHPLLLPFQNDVDMMGKHFKFVECLKDIATYLVQQLQELSRNCSGAGNLLQTWKAYQFEMSMELLWWGKMNSHIDGNLATNLGPGDGTFNRASTCRQGFLSLENVLDCVINPRSTPPLRHWTNSDIQKARIRRVFSIGDYLKSNSSVLGSRILLILIEDIKAAVQEEEGGLPSLLADLRGKNPPPWSQCIASITAKDLCKDLCNRELYKFPMTFGRVIDIVRSNDRSVFDVLLAGMVQQHINFFPLILKRPSFRWKQRNVYRVLFDDDLSGWNLCKAETLTAEIIALLEREDLVFRSKFYNAPAILPWITEVCHRLRGMKLEDSEFKHVLTFVSCIALLEQGYYVNYRSLFNYESRMCVSQSDLQSLNILSPFCLNISLGKRFFRIHEDIPIKIQLRTGKDKANTQDNEEPMTEIIPEDIPPVDTEQDVEEDISILPVTHLPSRSRLPWNSVELSILNNVHSNEKKTYKEMYADYCDHCRRKGIPDRTFPAFKRAMMRLVKKK